MIKYAYFIEERPVSRNSRPTRALTARTMINERGQEVLDKTPVEIPIKLESPASSMMEYMHALYRRMAEEKEVETFEDANNFDIPDETGIEMTDTPYEHDFDHLAETSGAVPAPDEGSPVPSPTPESVQE